MVKEKVASMNAALRLMKWLLKTMKIKESYDCPMAEIEATKKKLNIDTK